VTALLARLASLMRAVSEIDPGTGATELGRGLAELFGSRLVVEETLVDHRYRLVLRARLDGGRVALKAFSEPHRAGAELQAMLAAEAGGISVPPVLGHWASDDAIVIALGWVQGAALGAERADWAAAGSQLARLHALPLPVGLGSVSGWEADWDDDLVRQVPNECARAARLGLLSSAEVDRVRDSLGPALARLAPARLAFLHGDLQPEHVILGSGGGVTLIDWGDSGSGDPLWDIAVLINDDLDRLDDVLAGYRPGPELTAHLGTNLDTFRALRYLQEATWLAERSFDPAPSVAGLLSLIG